ncbi:MAG TPA: LamG-like jellyroll fold domain-containing protein [Anaerolineales bacterium]|nr:LamG-like jellyroll fold domain-containing protein [Anaerolineales bacterium]
MRNIVALLCLVAVVSACVPQPPTPSLSIDDQVATSVAGTLAAEGPTLPPPPASTNTSPPPATESPTDVPTQIPPTATPIPTQTPFPTSTPTAVSGDPRTTLGQPAWRDPMESPAGWNVGEDTYTKISVEDGKLILTGKSTIDGWRLTWPEIEDVYLEATIATKTCTANDHYGLIFRVPDRHSPNEGYLLGFTCDGRYWFRSWDGEQMDTLVGLTVSSAINAGSNKSNRVGVMMDGDKFKLYANGTLLQEVTDDTWSEKGGIGVFIGARQTDGFTTETDEIAYWNLP